MSTKQTAKKKQRPRQDEPDTIIPPRPAPLTKVEFDDGDGFATGVAAGSYSVESPGDRIELWSPSPPAPLFAAYRSAVKVTGTPAPGIAFKVLLTKQTLLSPTEHLHDAFVRLLKASSKTGPGGRLTFDLTKVTELRDPRQMKEGPNRAKEPTSNPPPISVADAVRVFEGLSSQLDELQMPVTDPLELYLHELPRVKFESLEERRHFESTLQGLLARLDKRVVRYDASTNRPLDGDRPSALRCNPTGQGYFFLEHFEQGDRFKQKIGKALSPLSLAPRPPHGNKRPR